MSSGTGMSSSLVLRLAEPEDGMAVAQVHVRSWQAAYRGILSDAYLDGLRPEDRAAKYNFASGDPREPHTIVATEQGLIHGFATTLPCREAGLGDYGELLALYVDPKQWGRGIGVALLSTARTRLLELGFPNAVLWVLVGNVRAESFYQRDGWETDGVRRTDTIWGVTVDELRYRRLGSSV